MGIEPLFIVVGFVFALLAGLVAFLITYQEYSRHKFGGWLLWRPPLSAAFFTFVFFFALSRARLRFAICRMSAEARLRAA